MIGDCRRVSVTAGIGAAELQDGTQSRGGGGGAKHAAQDVQRMYQRWYIISMWI